MIEVINKYNNYKYHEVVQLIENFVINDLSRKYIQIIRERENETFEILNEIRIGILKILSPIIPFTTEKVWLELHKKSNVKEESIHLTNFPEINKGKINKELESDFEKIMKVIEIGLAERDKAKIGLRWPLSEATIKINFNLNSDLKEIILRQLNIKKINILQLKNKNDVEVKLNTELLPELEAEGYTREISRKIQSLRKTEGLNKNDLINLIIKCDSESRVMLEQNLLFLKDKTNSQNIDFSDDENEKFKSEFEIKGKKFAIDFRNYPVTGKKS